MTGRKGRSVILLATWGEGGRVKKKYSRIVDVPLRSLREKKIQNVGPKHQISPRENINRQT